MLQWLHIKKKSNTIFKRRTFESRFSTRSCWAITTTIIIEAPLIIENIRLCFSLDMHIKGTFLNSINFIANSLSYLGRRREVLSVSLYFICIIQIKKDDIWIAKYFDKINCIFLKDCTLRLAKMISEFIHWPQTRNA